MSRSQGSYQLRWSEYLSEATSSNNPKGMDRRSIFHVSLIGSCAVSRVQPRFVRANYLHRMLLAFPFLSLSVGLWLIRFQSRLLVTNVLDRDYILCYEAQITTELLNGLRNPRDATNPLEWPTIRRRKVAYKPYHTFAGRLVAELVAPSPSFSRDSFNSPDDLNGVIEHERKRPHGQEDSGSYKVRRT